MLQGDVLHALLLSRRRLWRVDKEQSSMAGFIMLASYYQRISDGGSPPFVTAVQLREMIPETLL